MKITFLGAAKTVTGSCYLIETQKTKFLVDCGLFQGHAKEEALNVESFPINPAELDYIFLTHAHIDHSGRIPKIYKDGFKGDIYATKATVELCEIMLPDCGHIQESENEWKNKKRLRAGKPPLEPVYTYQDALDCLQLFKKVNYGEALKINEEIKVRFNDAGHILGSSIIEFWIWEKGKETKIVFSGDLGNRDMPILRDPSIIESADYLVIESTYGNRIHENKLNKFERFIDIINETIDKGGNVIIPSFAVGRTQEVIYELNKEKESYDSKVKKLFSIPVYVDSPLAISATEVFRKNLDCYDEEAREYIKNGDNPLDFPGLQFTRTPEESKSLNERSGSSIIISASGMCDAGRIKHHLKHNLWREESSIVFVGYQAPGTLGRQILDGKKQVRIHGEQIAVNAQIYNLDGFSGHADQKALLQWFDSFKRKPKEVFLVHGEPEGMEVFKNLLLERYDLEVHMPELYQTFDLRYGQVKTYDIEGPTEKDIAYIYANIINKLSELYKTNLERQEIKQLYEKLKSIENAI